MSTPDDNSNSVVIQRPTDKERFRVTYTQGVGFQFEPLPKSAGSGAASAAPGVELSTMRNVLFWVRNVLLHRDVYPFDALQTWCLVACMAQISVLVVLTFEEPGFTNEDTDTLRYISNNIDVHRGYGTAMLIAFAMSYIPLLIYHTQTEFISWLQFLGVTLASLGGCFVVMCHSSNSESVTGRYHLMGALVFVLGGQIGHFTLMYDISKMQLHASRDIVLATVNLLSFGTFFCTIIAIGLGDYSREEAGTLYWVSAGAEYILYFSFVSMNILIGERIVDNFTSRITHTLLQGPTAGKTFFLADFYDPVQDPVHY